jgi:four helix bundle protein
MNTRYGILSILPREEQCALSNQLRRAMDSVILNIAEGSYRKSDKDFAHFLLSAEELVKQISAFASYLKK